MSNLPAVNPSQLGTALAAAKTRLSMDAGDSPFLRLLKSGEWVYSADDVEVQEGSLWAVNTASLSEGYAAWGKGELLGEAMAPMTGTPVLLANLEDVGATYQKQVGFLLKCLNGDDKEVQVLYKTTSKGGIKAANKLIASILEQIEANPAAIVPVITLEMDSYKHKEYGKIYTPIFQVKDWMDFSGPDDAEDEPEEDAPKPAARKRKATAPVEEVEEVDEVDEDEVEEDSPKPKRRRRAIAT
tara:strand:- start:737 stop:1462 length:726 start_codon:yes stop_codon:yes gene_type:complete